MDEGHQPKTEMNGQKGSNLRREIIQKGASQAESILMEGTGEPPGIRTRDPRLKSTVSDEIFQ